MILREQGNGVEVEKPILGGTLPVPILLCFRFCEAKEGLGSATGGYK